MMSRRYVGAREVVARTGNCRACGKTSVLSDFETREYLSVLAVPLLPLGRFHVKDRCAACGQHRRMALADYREGLRSRLEREQRAASRSPVDAARRATLVDLQRGLGDFPAAEATLRQGLSATPGDPALLRQLGELLETRGRLQPALEPLQQAARAAPGSFLARLALGRVLARLGRYDEAIEELRAARRIDPHHPATHWLLGQCCAGLDRRSDALRHYEELLGRRPELRADAEIWQRIGALKRALGYSLTPAERRAARPSSAPSTLLPSPLSAFVLARR